MRTLKISILTILTILGIYSAANAAPVYRLDRSILPETTNTYYLGSTSPSLQWKGIYTKDLTVTGTCTGCGGGGSGSSTGWASSTDPTSIYFTGSGGVGIGTDSPVGKLSVLGTTTISYPFPNDSGTAADTIFDIANTNDSTGVSVQTTSFGGVTASMVRTDSSNEYVLSTRGAPIYIGYGDLSGSGTIHLSSVAKIDTSLEYPNATVFMDPSSNLNYANGATMYSASQNSLSLPQNGQLLDSLGSAGNNGDVLQTTGTTAVWTALSSGGGAFPFTPVASANSTSTTIQFYNGLGTQASSTLGALYLSANKGNAGIGSSSPSQAFSIQGNTLISGDITSVANLTATGTVTLNNTAAVSVPLQINFPSANGSIRLSRTGTNAGNVSLQVTSNGGAQLSSDSDFNMAPGSVANTILAVGSGAVANTLVLRTGSAGIGTSTPSRTLSVQGNTLISGDITNVANITATGTVIVGGNILPAAALGTSVLGNSSFRWNTISVQNVNSTNQVMGNFFDGNSGNAATIRSNGGNTQGIIVTTAGLIGIGATSTPTQTLSVQGSALISGNITSVANITATGTLTLSALSNGCANITSGAVGSTGSACNTGTVTSIATNNGLTGGTINTTGTIGLDLTKLPVNNLLLTYNGSQIQATGTPTLTAGNYIATSTASSTYSGGIDAARVCLTGTTTCLAPSGAASSATIYQPLASTSLTNGSYPLSTSTTVVAGEYVTIWMNCTKPNAAGSTIWHLNASNGQGTTTIGYSQMQQTGGTNPNMSLPMFGTWGPATTSNPVRLSWATSDDTSISDSSTCNSAFQFTIQRVKPTQ